MPDFQRNSKANSAQFSFSFIKLLLYRVFFSQINFYTQNARKAHNTSNESSDLVEKNDGLRNSEKFRELWFLIGKSKIFDFLLTLVKLR